MLTCFCTSRVQYSAHLLLCCRNCAPRTLCGSSGLLHVSTNLNVAKYCSLSQIHENENVRLLKHLPLYSIVCLCKGWTPLVVASLGASYLAEHGKLYKRELDSLAAHKLLSVSSHCYCSRLSTFYGIICFGYEFRPSVRALRAIKALAISL